MIASLLSPIEDPLTWLLEELHTALELPWGWAVVGVTILVRMLLVPVTVKQIRSMQRMQQYLPQMKAIQQKHKGNRQKSNEELMKFYKEHNINPAASCLPMVLQIPIFFGLYFVLRDFEEEIYEPKYPGSDLGWLSLVPNITDNITDHWSGYLLCVVYAGSQVASTYFMSTTMERTQRILFMVLPLGFVLFILSGNVEFPVGLLIYWVTTNLWTVGQGLVTRRHVPRAAVPPKRSSRAPLPDSGGTGDRAAAAEGRGSSSPAQPRRVKRKKKGARR